MITGLSIRHNQDRKNKRAWGGFFNFSKENLPHLHFKSKDFQLTPTILPSVIAVFLLLIWGVFMFNGLKTSASARENGSNNQSLDISSDLAEESSSTDNAAVQSLNTTETENATNNNVNIDFKSSSYVSSDPDNNSSSASLRVNGQNVPVNDPGNVNQHYESSDGNTTVDLNINSSSTAGGGM
jgi:hypothetical protein